MAERRPDPELLERVKAIAPGFYTEMDDGDWYIVTPDHGNRIGEDFRHRDDARRLLAHIAGDLLPKGWTMYVSPSGQHADLDCGQGYAATVWVAVARAYFPNWTPAPSAGQST